MDLSGKNFFGQSCESDPITVKGQFVLPPGSDLEIRVPKRHLRSCLCFPWSLGTEDELWRVSCSDGLGDGSALRMDCTHSQNFWRQRLFIFHGSEVTWPGAMVRNSA